MRREIAVESTTLPDGAIVSVARITSVTLGKSGRPEDTKESTPHSEVIAKHADKEIRMTVAQMSPNALPGYLALTVREINKLRERLTSGQLKPLVFKTPQSFTEFVQTMAAHEMFIL